jgi:mRNA interferase MazF
MGRKRMAMVVKRFDVYLVNLDHAAGSEIQKIRPCVVISPDEMNYNIRSVIIAPMTSVQKEYPTRISCTFQEEKGQIVLDRLQTIDKARFIRRLGTIDSKDQLEVISILQRLFAF